MTLLAFFFLSDPQIAGIDISRPALMGIVMTEGALEGDVAGTIQLYIRRLAALAELDGEVAGTLQRQTGLIDIDLTDAHIAGAYHNGRRCLRIEMTDTDIAGTNQLRDAHIADDVLEGDIA